MHWTCPGSRAIGFHDVARRAIADSGATTDGRQTEIGTPGHGRSSRVRIANAAKMTMVDAAAARERALRFARARGDTMADPVTFPGKPSVIVRIPTPIWLVGMIVLALLLGEALQPAVVLQQRPVGIAVLLAGFLWAVGQS